MTDQEFEEHVERLERIARGDPRRYRVRVTAMALLGYAYLLAVLVGGVALAAGALWLVGSGPGGLALQLCILAALLAIDIVRALWVRLPAPAGIPLTRARDGALLQRVEEICRALGAPRPHVVLATSELNASVAQIPRFGVLGWQKNYLVIGLSLMRALSPAEFDALLAHEFGHLAGSHSWFNGWIYRLRMSWLRLLASLERQKSLNARLFQGFARWYVPRFNATSFVQARAQEYEADQAAARICSPRTAADTLLRVAIAGARAQEDFWAALWLRARVSGEPPATPFELLGAGLESGELRGAQPRSDAEIIAAELELETTLVDTHPCLRERLAALGVAVDLAPPARIATSAASHYLNARAPELEAALSREWCREVREVWRGQFAKAEANRARLVELAALSGARALAVEETWEQALCLWADERRDEALAVVRTLVERQPDFAPAQRSWGMHLLESGDDAGLAYIDRALALSRDGGISACEAARVFLEARGRCDEARVYVERVRLLEQWVEGARAERASVDITNELKPHALAPAALEALCEQLRADPRIERAYLAEKVLAVAPEYPVYVLAFRLRREWLWRKYTLPRVQKEIAERLVLDGDFFCLALGLAQRSLRRRVLVAAGEPIYRAR